MRYTYPARFVEEQDGYSVSFPAFESVYTEGDTFEEAADMAAEALELAITHYIDGGQPLPTPVNAEGTVLVSVEVDTTDALVSTKEAAKILGVNASRVRQMVGSGTLAAKKQGRDNYVYRWSVLDRLNSPRTVGRPKTHR